MTANTEVARARRYLLGEATDQESMAIEQEYLEHEEAVSRMAAAEDDLIEAYLSGELSAIERERFERAYLTAPHRRVRVETIRRLMTEASRTAPARAGKGSVLAWAGRRGPLLALAASVLVVASLALWRSAPPADRPSEIAGNPETPAAETPAVRGPGTAPAAPRLFAVTISPVAVRSDAQAAAVVVPAGTEIVVVRFESDPENQALVPRRASIQTVSGEEVWQGPATVENNPPPGTVARIDVPTDRLPADDYVVVLYGVDEAGVEREWTRNFFPVRTR